LHRDGVFDRNLEDSHRDARETFRNLSGPRATPDRLKAQRYGFVQTRGADMRGVLYSVEICDGHAARSGGHHGSLSFFAFSLPTAPQLLMQPQNSSNKLPIDWSC